MPARKLAPAPRARPKTVGRVWKRDIASLLSGEGGAIARALAYGPPLLAAAAAATPAAALLPSVDTGTRAAEVRAACSCKSAGWGSRREAANPAACYSALTDACAVAAVATRGKAAWAEQTRLQRGAAGGRPAWLQPGRDAGSSAAGGPPQPGPRLAQTS